jgi:hypothetical protein
MPNNPMQVLLDGEVFNVLADMTVYCLFDECNDPAGYSDTVDGASLLEVFSTRELAQAELDVLMEDLHEAVERGDMEDVSIFEVDTLFLNGAMS